MPSLFFASGFSFLILNLFKLKRLNNFFGYIGLTLSPKPKAKKPETPELCYILSGISMPRRPTPAFKVRATTADNSRRRLRFCSSSSFKIE